jgi:hypothetical protein
MLIDMERRPPRLSAIRLILVAAVAAASLSGCDYFSNLLDKNDATLSSLTITDNDGNVLALSPSFSRSTIKYTATVSSTATSLTINAVTNYSGASAWVDGGDPSTASTGSVTSAYALASTTSEFVVVVMVAAANQSGLVYTSSDEAVGEPTQTRYEIDITRATS